MKTLKFNRPKTLPNDQSHPISQFHLPHFQKDTNLKIHDNIFHDKKCDISSEIKIRLLVNL